MKKWRFVSVFGLALFFALTGQTAHTLQAVAQTSALPTTPITSAQCQQERSETLQELYFLLSWRFTGQLETEQYQAASATYAQIMQLISVIPSQEMRSAYFSDRVGADLWGSHLSQVALLIELGETGDRRQILAGLEQGVTIAQTLGEDYASVSTRGLIAIARVYASFEQPDRAKSALGLARETYTPDQGPAILIEIAQSYRYLGETATMQALLQQAQTQAAQMPVTNPEQRHQALAEVGIAYAEADDLRSAQQVAQIIQGASESRDRLLQAMVQASLRTNHPEPNLEQAAATAAAIHSPRWRALSFNDMAQKQYSLGNENQAQALLQDAVQIVSSTGDSDVLETTLTHMIQWFPEQAEPIVQQLTDPHQQIVLLGLLANQYYGLGQPDKANTIADQLQKRLASLEPSWQEIYAQRIAEGVVQDGGFGNDLWITLIVTETNPALRSSLLRAVIVPALLSSNEVQIAAQAVAAIPDDDIGLKSEALANLGAAYVNAGDRDQALALENRARSHQRTDFLRWAQVRATVARQLMVRDQPEVGRDLLAQIQEQVSVHPDAQIRVEALSVMVQAFAQKNQSIPASLLPALTRAVQAISPDQRSTLLAGLSEKLVGRYQFAAALAVNQLLPLTETSRELAMSEIARGAMGLGQYALARDAIAQSQTPSIQVSQLIALSDFLTLDQRLVEAGQALNEAVSIALTIPGDESVTIPTGNDQGGVEDPLDRASLLQSVAIRYVALDRASEAETTLGHIQNQAQRDQTTQKLQCYQ